MVVACDEVRDLVRAQPLFTKNHWPEYVIKGDEIDIQLLPSKVHFKCSLEDEPLLWVARWSPNRKVKKDDVEGIYIKTKKLSKEKVRGGSTYFHSLVQPVMYRRSVDHVDRDPSNNRRDNLRVATYTEQNVNREIVHGDGEKRLPPGITFRERTYYASWTKEPMAKYKSFMLERLSGRTETVSFAIGKYGMSALPYAMRRLMDNYVTNSLYVSALFPIANVLKTLKDLGLNSGDEEWNAIDKTDPDKMISFTRRQLRTLKDSGYNMWQLVFGGKYASLIPQDEWTVDDSVATMDIMIRDAVHLITGGMSLSSMNKSERDDVKTKVSHLSHVIEVAIQSLYPTVHMKESEVPSGDEVYDPLLLPSDPSPEVVEGSASDLSKTSSSLMTCGQRHTEDEAHCPQQDSSSSPHQSSLTASPLSLNDVHCHQQDSSSDGGSDKRSSSLQSHSVTASLMHSTPSEVTASSTRLAPSEVTASSTRLAPSEVTRSSGSDKTHLSNPMGGEVIEDKVIVPSPKRLLSPSSSSASSTGERTKSLLSRDPLRKPPVMSKSTSSSEKTTPSKELSVLDKTSFPTHIASRQVNLPSAALTNVRQVESPVTASSTRSAPSEVITSPMYSVPSAGLEAKSSVGRETQKAISNVLSTLTTAARNGGDEEVKRISALLAFAVPNGDGQLVLSHASSKAADLTPSAASSGETLEASVIGSSVASGSKRAKTHDEIDRPDVKSWMTDCLADDPSHCVMTDAIFSSYQSWMKTNALSLSKSLHRPELSRALNKTSLSNCMLGYKLEKKPVTVWVGKRIVRH